MPIWDLNRIRSVADIRRFHEDLKQRMPGVSGFAQLQGLKNQSDELCYLVTHPRASERFGDQVTAARREALLQNAELAQLANEIAKKHDWNRRFRSWADLMHVPLPAAEPAAEAAPQVAPTAPVSPTPQAPPGAAERPARAPRPPLTPEEREALIARARAARERRLAGEPGSQPPSG